MHAAVRDDAMAVRRMALRAVARPLADITGPVDPSAQENEGSGTAAETVATGRARAVEALKSGIQRRKPAMSNECVTSGMKRSGSQYRSKMMTPIHTECMNYASENGYVLARYAQGDWQYRDPELLLYLEIPNKPPIVAVGLTERAVRCLRNSNQETQGIASTALRAGAMMRLAAGGDDIPCAAFVPARDARRLKAYLSWHDSVTHSAAPTTLDDFKGGLLPTYDAGSDEATLIVKAMKEFAVTARLRKRFHIYLVPLRAGDVDTFGLLSAFFDDHDEPLTIWTPLFDDDLSPEFLRVLSLDSFDVHFFDQHNRKLIAFRAKNPDAARFRDIVKTIRLVPSTLESARQFYNDTISWFGKRSTAEDDASFTIELLEMIPPDNLHEQSQTSPGDLNEGDIETGLHRAFSYDQVHRNPIRADNAREFVDVLVATDRTILLIQAKDSPATEGTLDRTIDRKKAVSKKHIRKAASQLKGSINHLRSGDSIEIITDGQSWELSSSGRQVVGLVIVKELFDHERLDCSRLVLAVFEETGVPCLLLDYGEFEELTFFRPAEASLVVTLKQTFEFALDHHTFPRSRFGFVEEGPVLRTSPSGADTTEV